MSGANSDDELARTATAPGSSSGEPAPAPALGATLGRYRLERMLGEGGMGVVHAAFDPDLERRVALKVLRSEGSDDARQRLLREARAMARLTHPNVVTVHEVGTAGGRDYVAMELVDGETLADWLRAEKRTPAEIVAAFAAAGRGLAAAHAAGLVHRDFKPHNVLRRRDGRICVTDFGLARGVETAGAIALETTLQLRTGAAQDNTPSPLSGLTATGSVLGTPAYMAPEQWTGGTVGPAADQFAFCVALWEALTGERPFRGATLEALKQEVARGPSALDDSALPRRLRAVLRRGLDPDPARRYPSMDALLAALGRTAQPHRAALVAGGFAVVAAAVVFAALGHAARESFPAPPLPPQSVWSPERAIALARAGQLAGAEALAADFPRWLDARARACHGAPEVRAERLACLDGVLAHFAAGERALERLKGSPNADVGAMLVDPAVCEQARPPRLSTSLSEPRIAAEAALLATTVEAQPVPEAKLDALIAATGSDPCGAAIARLAAALDRTTDLARKRDLDEAASAAPRCGDDRLSAVAAYGIAKLALDEHELDARAKLERFEAAAGVVMQPDLRARLDLLRASVARAAAHVDEAIARYEAARDGFAARGRLRPELEADLSIEGLLEIRARPADLAAVSGRLATWRARAVAAFGAGDPIVRSIDTAIANWMLSSGDVAGAHARFLALLRSRPIDHAVHASGRVVDEHGAPVAGATVCAGTAIDADSVGFIPGPKDRVATTAADGTFELPEAEADGSIIARLGDRMSTPAKVGDHLTLALAPTSRLEGHVDLRGAAPTSVLIFVRDPDRRFGELSLIAPVLADGSFAISGVPRGKMTVHAQVDVLPSPRLSGTEVTVHDPVVRGIALAVPISKRVVHVVVRSTVSMALNDAAVFVLPGHVAATNLAQLLGAMRDIEQVIATPIDGEHAPQPVLQLAKAGDVYAEVSDAPEGVASVCGLALPTENDDPDLQQKINTHMDRLEIRCVPLGEHEDTVLLQVPPWPRLD